MSQWRPGCITKDFILKNEADQKMASSQLIPCNIYPVGMTHVYFLNYLLTMAKRVMNVDDNNIIIIIHLHKTIVSIPPLPQMIIGLTSCFFSIYPINMIRFQLLGPPKKLSNLAFFRFMHPVNR